MTDTACFNRFYFGFELLCLNGIIMFAEVHAQLLLMRFAPDWKDPEPDWEKDVNHPLGITKGSSKITGFVQEYALPQIGAYYGLTQFGSGARDKSEEKWLSFRSLTTWLPLQENTTIVIRISHLSLQIQMRLKCARGILSQPTTPCFSHYNFQRFCRVVQAHYMYLRKLPEFEIQCFSSYKVKNGKGEKWVLWKLMCFTLRLSE